MKEALHARIDADFDHRQAATVQELAELTASKTKLEREQDKLLELHFADAIDTEQFRRHQDRIRAELYDIRTRINTSHSGYQEARDLLADSLELIENCHAIYALCDDANRRLCNQAFFTKI